MNLRFDALRADAAFSVRLWQRNPGWTAVALLSLALGIGANALVFSVVDAVLLRPFPYPHDDRLVFLWGSRSANQTPGLQLNLREWRKTSRTLADADVFLGNMRLSLGAEESDTVGAASIGVRILPTLGVLPALGRNFTESETRRGGEPAVILSDDLWRARFSADPSIVGRTIHVGGYARNVIGVMPAGFFFPDVEARLWVPLQSGIDETQMHGLARLAPGASLEQAQAEFDAANQQAARANPPVRRVTGVFPIRQIVVGNFQRALWMLLASVVVVLLIACANVAHLQLSRAIDRQTELAIRSAAGATRGRLVRQLLTESVILAVAATGLGLFIGWAGLRLIHSRALTDIPRLEAARLDERVFAVAAIACIVTTLVSGLWPAWKVSRVQADETLKTGGGTTTGARRSQTRDLLAVTEVALATVLLVVAGLVVRSFVQISRSDWGFNPDNALLIDVRVPPAVYGDPIASLEWAQRAVDRLTGIAGVEAASHSNGVPIRWKAWWPIPISVDGRFVQWTAGVWTVGHSYFSAAGISILQGREFRRTDDASAPRRIVVSRRFAETAWPGSQALGRHVQLMEQTARAGEELRRRLREGRSGNSPLTADMMRVAEGSNWQVIGVVENVRMFGLEVESNPAMYVVDEQLPRFMLQPVPTIQFLVRTAHRDPGIPTRAKAAILAVDASAGFSEVAWMADLVEQSIGGRGSNKLMLLVSTAFGSLALGFAGIGIYGMVSLTVTQRLRELAIRAAMGADRRQIAHAVLSHMARLLFAGVALGLTIAWAATRSMATLLFQVTPADPLSYVLAVLALSAAGCLACLIPLRRALGFDPVSLLKG